jgi:hypothetical protein
MAWMTASMSQWAKVEEPIKRKRLANFKHFAKTFDLINPQQQLSFIIYADSLLFEETFKAVRLLDL